MAAVIVPFLLLYISVSLSIQLKTQTTQKNRDSKGEFLLLFKSQARTNAIYTSLTIQGFYKTCTTTDNTLEPIVGR